MYLNLNTLFATIYYVLYIKNNLGKLFNVYEIKSKQLFLDKNDSSKFDLKPTFIFKELSDNKWVTHLIM